MLLSAWMIASERAAFAALDTSAVHGSAAVNNAPGVFGLAFGLAVGLAPGEPGDSLARLPALSWVLQPMHAIAVTDIAANTFRTIAVRIPEG